MHINLLCHNDIIYIQFRITVVKVLHYAYDIWKKEHISFRPLLGPEPR